MRLNNRRSFLASTGALLGASLAMPMVHASAEWPQRPLRMVVPFSVGGSPDIFGRLLADRLSRSLGQAVVVDNKPGANGLLGNDTVAKAPADGYTLLMTSASSTVMAEAMGYKTPYQFERDLQPLAKIVAGGVLLLARPDFPASELNGLIQVLRANPGKYAYGSWGVGSTGHLIMEALKRKEDLDSAFVAYKGGAPVIQDMVSGVIPLGWADPAAALPMVEAGKVKPIGLTGTVRVPKMPEIRTFAEQGHPLGTDGWSGFLLRRGVPDPIVLRLNREIATLMQSPEIQQRVLDLNAVAAPPRTASELEQDLREEIATWRSMIQKYDIRFES